jgi:hypothetical protein
LSFHATIGYVLQQTQSWNLVFAAPVVFYAIGFSMFWVWAQGSPQFR